MRKYADILKALSEPKRLKLFTLLIKGESKYYVCELADATEDTHYNTSRHLNELRKVGLVEEQKMGRGVMYYIPEAEDPFVKMLIELIKSIPDDCILREMELLKKRVLFRGEGQRCVFKLGHDWKSKKLKEREESHEPGE